MEDVPGLKLKFIKISGTFMLSALTQEQIDMLLKGNPNDPQGYWPIETVYNMFPRKPGSRARKHTLIFRPNNWSLTTSDSGSKASSYSGIYFHLENGILYNGSIIKPSNGFIFPVKMAIGDVAIVATEKGEPITYQRLETISESLGVNVTEMRLIKAQLEWFTPSVHKSLIQKCIRTRAKQVDFFGTKYSCSSVLITSFCMLMVHPGAFVHNIQRFVSGIESALKRLAVAINEDSYIADPKYISTLYAATWIVQNEAQLGWNPSENLLKIWIQTALVALNEPRMYKYDWHNPGQLTQINNLTLNYSLLQAIGSFPSDVNMLLSIANNQGIPEQYIDINNERIMPIVHCIDHHSYTDIAHYFSMPTVERVGNYSDLFTLIWNDVVGYNPRKEKYSTSGLFVGNLTDIQQEIRNAQEITWLTHSRLPVPMVKSPIGVTTINYKLKDSWLASFVGPIEYRVPSGTAITMIHPDDIYSYTAVKRPSRDVNANPELTEEEKSLAIEQLKGQLRMGIVPQNIPETLRMLKGIHITYNNEIYLVNNYPWDIFKNLSIQIGVFDYEITPNLLRQACTETGSGLHKECHVKFKELLTTFSLPALKRALLYLSSFNSEVELHHIGRDGTGTEYAVSVYDTHVNHLLSLICAIYPGVLGKHKNKYQIKIGPVFWNLVDYIRKLSTTGISDQVIAYWGRPNPERRQLWEHQKEAIDKLITTKEQGKSLRIIWIPPGLGKTAIITNYISRLIITGKMPQYALYTLPPSALETVKREFTFLGIPFVHLNMTVQAGGQKPLQAGVVNIIYHDHLRMSDMNQIRTIAPQMLFIVDEFHKTLNKTLRTSFALEIARLSSDTIAMTGTLIKDTNVEDLIQWVEQTVDFEVTTKNYWVAVSSIISRKVETKVVVDRQVIEAKMTSEELNDYYSVVPKTLGGMASKIDFRQAVQYSYQTITREIIRYIMFHLQNNVPVFVVARNIAHQEEIRNILNQNGIQDIFLIGTGRSISLTPMDPPPGTYVPRVVITTTQHAEGYNMTRFIVMITGVYFSNEATREQLERRINRIDQISPQIRIIIIHAGIISYIHANYEKARSLSAAIKGFAKDAQLELDTDEMSAL
jgi:hypothetical protein